MGRKRNANLDEELRTAEKTPREKAAQQFRKRLIHGVLSTTESEGKEDGDLRGRNNPFEIHNSRQNHKT